MDRRVKHLWEGLIILAIMILNFTVIVAAGLFDVLDEQYDEQYIENIKEMPDSVNLSPDKNWQPSYDQVTQKCKRKYSPKFIYGWLDFLGFKNMVKVNNIQYYNPLLSGEPIVRYETYSCVLGHRLFKGNMNNDLKVEQNGNQVVAELKSTQILYWIPSGGNWIYDNITKVFYDSEPAPQIYNNTITPIVEITEFNNTIEPKIVISVTEPNASKIIIQYDDKIATHTQKAYHIEITPKGIYFANATSLETWDVHGTNIARFGKSVIINTNLSLFNYSQLNITVSDIFGSIYVEQSEFNITRITYEPEKIVYNPLLFGFMGIILTFFGASAYIIKRL